MRESGRSLSISSLCRSNLCGCVDVDLNYVDLVCKCQGVDCWLFASFEAIGSRSVKSSTFYYFNYFCVFLLYFYLKSTHSAIIPQILLQDYSSHWIDHLPHLIILLLCIFVHKFHRFQ